MRRLVWCGILGAVGLVLVVAQVPEPQPAAEAIRLNNLGVATMNQQRLEDALKLFEQASALDGELFAARLNRGIALLNLQRYDAARAVLLDATRREPARARAWYNLGLLYRSQGQAEPALAAFDRVAQIDPADADTQYFRGLLHSQLQQQERAIEAFERALALNALHASAEFGLARAYQRLGDTARARQHLARFQKLTQEKLSAPLGLAYGEQGAYSLAEQVIPPAGAVPPAIPVRFVSVAVAAGLRFEHGGTGSTEADPAETDLVARTPAGLSGSGACILDYDRDGRQDLFAVNSGKEAPNALFRNAGDGRFVDVTHAARLEARGYGMGCTVGDYDNDGWTDLAVSFFGRVALYRNQGDGTFREVTEAAGIRTDGFLTGLTWVDYDHDGDLDLYVSRFFFPRGDSPPPVAGDSGNVLWRNSGTGSFADRTEASGLGAVGENVTAVATDFNNDRAVDLVVTGRRTAIFVNPREGAFRAVEPWAEAMPAPTAGVAIFDFNKDGWMDLAFTHRGKPGLTVWRNVEGKRFEAQPVPELGASGWGLVALDYDNDGWVDLAAAGEAEEAERAVIRLLRNRGPEGFEDVTAAVGLDDVKLDRPRALLMADYDGDGDTDLLVTQNRGPLVLLRNDGGNKNGWMRVALWGLADNKSAIGTKVEVFAGGLWQKWEVAAGGGYLGQSALEVTAGLGSAREADIVRLLWPTGILQDEVNLAARAAHTLNEIDRRGSSCPILFAWNGARFEFITDVIGAGIVGHWVGPGERNVSDPTEYVKVESTQLKPRAGRLNFRFLEPMEELIYLDQVRLLAADHPAEAEVYPNEYFAGSPPFAPFQVIASRGARPPRGAWDDQGRDVLPKLLRRDRDYISGFGLLPFKGFAELHALELDLGARNASGPLRLLLDGFIDYFSANSVYAAHQAGVRPIPPYVEARDADGRWVRVVENMGFPAGLARTMVADLTGRLPAGTRRIRIVTNLQIYWDRIRIDTTPEGIPLRLTEVPLAEARLGFRGYPRAVEGEPRGDLSYIYEEVSATGPYAQHAGSYTRYGDVLRLVTSADDQFAIFGTGEEVALEFDPTGLPPLPAGWSRDWLFFADGFEKDMDFYEAHAETVEPLPFHAMGRYPYPVTKRYPEGEPHLRYRLEYNTRHLSGRSVAAFRFAYPQQKDN